MPDTSFALASADVRLCALFDQAPARIRRHRALIVANGEIADRNVAVAATDASMQRGAIGIEEGHALAQLFAALRLLGRNRYEQPLLVSYLRRRGANLEGTFTRFGLRATGYCPGYQTVQALERRVLLSAYYLDPSFGDDGTAAAHFRGASHFQASLVAEVDPQTVLVVGALDSRLDNVPRRLVMAQFDAHTGQLKEQFGDGGMLTSIPVDRIDDAQRLPDGRLLVLAVEDWQPFVARFTPAGALDTSFAGDGKLAKYRDAIAVESDDHRVLTASVLGEDGAWTTFMTSRYHRVG